MNGRPDERKRAVITGMGLVTCLKSNLDDFWKALLDGQSGVRRISSFDASELPCQIAGEIPDFDPLEYLHPKETRRLSRSSQIALVAAEKAFADSGLTDPMPEPERVGVYFGTAIGGFEKAEQAMLTLRNEGLSRVNPFALPSALPNMPAFAITARFHALGPNATITTACATGTQAVGEAAAAIRHGRADVVFAGGAESMITEYVIAGFSAMRALPTSFNDDPERASRPFDANREGFVPAEGSACLILESLEHAQARNARIYAEVVGFASSSDAYHIAAPDPSAAGQVRTMRWALEDGGIAPEEVDYINAHGTSTPANDATETLAIRKFFGDHANTLAVSSTKSMVGHAMGASGTIEALVCALTIQRGIIHPTINIKHADPECDLDYVPDQARESRVRIALSNSFGLGGQNACLVLSALED